MTNRAVLPDGLGRFPPREILFTVILRGLKDTNDRVEKAPFTAVLAIVNGVEGYNKS